jgi:hypothetical protein
MPPEANPHAVAPGIDEQSFTIDDFPHLTRLGAHTYPWDNP